MAKTSKTKACETAGSERVRYSSSSKIDAYAEDVLDMSLSGKSAVELASWLLAQGCEVGDRNVRKWLAAHSKELDAARAERLRNIAYSCTYADRVNRVRILDRKAKRLVRVLSSPADPEDMEFLNGNSLPLARELDDTLKQIQDECNDIEQPAKRMELTGANGGPVDVVEEIRWTVIEPKRDA